jgi:hypothetical protein
MLARTGVRNLSSPEGAGLPVNPEAGLPPRLVTLEESSQNTLARGGTGVTAETPGGAEGTGAGIT